jgi:hypothetical protein
MFIVLLFSFLACEGNFIFVFYTEKEQERENPVPPLLMAGAL